MQGDILKNKAHSSEEKVQVYRATATSNIIIVCEHGSNYIPAEFHNLGLTEDVCQTHIAWDIGAYEVARALSDLLDATLISPCFSRLVYDCNRGPSSSTAIPEQSEIYQIPGNQNLSETEKRYRISAYYQPYWQQLTCLMMQRIHQSLAPVIVTIHSFTPIFKEFVRTTEIGIIHDADTRLADRLLQCAKQQTQYQFSRNEPYGPTDDVTHTLKYQAMAHQVENAMVEIRNDLIRSPDQQVKVARVLANCLQKALI